MRDFLNHFILSARNIYLNRSLRRFFLIFNFILNNLFCKILHLVGLDNVNNLTSDIVDVFNLGFLFYNLFWLIIVLQFFLALLTNVNDYVRVLITVGVLVGVFIAQLAFIVDFMVNSTILLHFDWC